MTRGIGGVALLQNLIPDRMAPLVALLTQLGDVWLFAFLLGVLYWRTPTRREALGVVGGLLLVGTGLYRGLKKVFALPRPGQPLLAPDVLPGRLGPVYETMATATGYGFPSGHATGATIVYFGLATVLAVGTPRRRFGVAALLVTVVCLSRVALGVHFLVDVAAGVVLGGSVLFVSRYGLDHIEGDRATPVFGAGILASTLYLLASRVEPEAVVLLFVAVGAFVGWHRLGP